MKNMPNKSQFLEELQWEKRSNNITIVLDKLTTTFRDQPVPDWGRVLEEEDFPRDYYATLAAMTVNGFFFTVGP